MTQLLSIFNKLGYAYRLLKTRMRWGWRLAALGRRALLGRCRLAVNPGTIFLGDHCFLSDDWALVDLAPGHGDPVKIRIGHWCRIQHDFQCNAAVGVEIGDHTLIAPRVFITDSDHVVDPAGEPTSLNQNLVSSAVVIEHDCWIGVNAVILKGVRIGHHSIVAANAVVTSDVEPFSIVGGVPAKVIGKVKNGTPQK